MAVVVVTFDPIYRLGIAGQGDDDEDPPQARSGAQIPR
jgi:hypothetical protein